MQCPHSPIAVLLQKCIMQANVSVQSAYSADLVVQVVTIAESMRLQAVLATYGIQTQTPNEIEPVQIWSQTELVKVYQNLGHNKKLGLKGRPPRPIGSLGTSKVNGQGSCLTESMRI